MNSELREKIKGMLPIEYDFYPGDNGTECYRIKPEPTPEIVESFIKLITQSNLDLLQRLESLPNICPEMIDGEFTHAQAIYKSAITRERELLESDQ